MDCQNLMPVVGGEVVPWLCFLSGWDCPYIKCGYSQITCNNYEQETENVSLESMQEAELNYREDDNDTNIS